MTRFASAIPFFTSFLFPFIALVALTNETEHGLILAWTLPFVAFVLLPILDQSVPMEEHEYTKNETQSRKNEWIYSIPLYLILPVQWIVVGFLVYKTSTLSLTDLNLEWLGLVFTVGICCGTFGINVAHELGHRTVKHAQFAARGLLLSSLYLHFIIEHNRGHHKHVATNLDPATSRYNQTVYAFWLQSVPGSWRSAWNLEAKRLDKKELNWYHNEMIWGTLLQTSLLVGIAAFFGWFAMVSFMFAAVIGILLLETINYLEHYGLERDLKDNGRFERVQPHHSWNCNRSVGRLVLFELTRHSDHHAHANRPYQILRHYDTAPQLPAGYPAMMVIALVPPLWFGVMNPRLHRYLNPRVVLREMHA